MKSQFYLLFIISCCILSCNSGNDKKERESIQLTHKKDSDQVVNANISSNNYKQEIITFLFHKFRNDSKLNKGENDFIIKEDIDFDGTNFKYAKITIPKFQLLKIQTENEYISIADINKKNERQIALDTTTIDGKLKIEKLESQKSIPLLFTGNWKLKASFLQEYDILDQREYVDAINFTDTIDLTNSKKYNQQNLFLKARIIELTVSDLDNFSKDELSYLRNELFARRGHIFKTDKMKSYFEKKSWYTPVLINATELLNEIEKKNIQLIKKLES